MCSDCTVGGWSDSVDICADCWTYDCERETDNKYHISTHMLVQLRRPIPRMAFHDRFGHAKRAVEASLEKMSVVLELTCAQCEKAIPEKPYWCCLVCDGTFEIS
jgi:hypothetical protein